jgi:acetyl CoA:N6-hydroxylysine acetyl transferase
VSIGQISLNQTLPTGKHIVLRRDGNEIVLFVDNNPAVKLVVTAQSDSQMTIEIAEVCLTDSEAAASILGLALHALFESAPALLKIHVGLARRDDLLNPLRALGLAVVEGEAVISRRSMLRQLAELWLKQPRSHGFPLRYVMTDGKRHPLRAPAANGEVYRRYLPQFGSEISFRTVDPVQDLEVFNAWHNNPRVAAFWELAGSRDMHREYLQKVTHDAHMHPVFGCFDDKPFGYFEIYWAKEDRIAPYYEVDDYDRGVHMLVGEESLRGPHRVAAWLPSLAHFMFLDDPRTRHVVAEPRADNAKMIGYMRQAGFYKTKEFDFPHKRAAMMMLSREAFFDQFCI